MPNIQNPTEKSDAGANSGQQPDDLHHRLDSLKSKLDDPSAPKGTKPDTQYDSAENRHTRAGVAQAFRLSSEFIAGVVVGAGIGYGVDTFFGTSPWGLIIFFMLGFGVAILNVMRAAGMVAESSMRLKPAYELQKKQQEKVNDEGSQK